MQYVIIDYTFGGCNSEVVSEEELFKILHEEGSKDYNIPRRKIAIYKLPNDAIIDWS